MCTATSEMVLRRIRAYAEHQRWTKSRLAAEAKLQDTTLRKFGREDWNPTVRVLRRLEQVIPPEFCPAADDGRADA